MKLKIDKQVKDLAKNLGVEIRCAATPKKAKIMKCKLPKHVIAAYVGEGIVFIRTPVVEDECYMSLVVLHEIGHAILDYYGMNNPLKINEDMANAIALGFAAKFRLPIRSELIKDIQKMMKEKRLRR